MKSFDEDKTRYHLVYPNPGSFAVPKTSCVWVEAPFSPENGPKNTYTKAMKSFDEDKTRYRLVY